MIDGQTQQGLEGVRLEVGDQGVFMTTAADGSFSLAARDDLRGAAFVRLKISRPEYVTNEFQGVVEAPAGTIQIVLVRRSDSRSSISGRLLNARDTARGIANATVLLTRGQNASPANNVGTTITDAAGNYRFTDLDAGTYTLSGVSAGFSECSRTTISVGPPPAASQDLVCSPAGDREIRIVLTGGRAPNDLDAHLTGPNADPSRFHVFYASRGSLEPEVTTPPFARLDVDDQVEHGPETVTATKLNPGGVYRYSVHDFTNRRNAGSTELGRSGAKVELYLNGLLPRVFHVPNQPGNLWAVFELSGDISAPTVVPRNEMSAVEEPADVP